MKNLSFALFFLLLLLYKTTSSSAQPAKVHFKSALDRIEAREFEKAILNLDKAIEADSMYPEAHEKRAWCYYNIGSFEKATKDYKVARRRKPQDKELKEQFAICLTRNENFDEAEKILNELLNEKKKNPELFTYRAECRVKSGNYNGAIEDGNIAAEDDKKNHRARFIRAIAYDSLKNIQMAIMDYEKAISIYEKYFAEERASDSQTLRKYFTSPMLMCMKNNDPDKALQFSEKGLQLLSGDAELIWLRGRCYANKMQWVNAIQEFNKSISQNDRNSEYFTDRGFAFLSQSKNEEALSDFSRALILNGKSHRAFYGKAGAEQALNMTKEAMTDYEKAMLIWPGNKTYKEAFAKAQEAYREKFREHDKPEVVISKPYIKADGNMVVPRDEQAFEIQGMAKDKSQIASIKINDIAVDFDASSLNPVFVHRMQTGNYQNITITVTDVFGNTSVSRYPVLRSEMSPPSIAVNIPEAKGNVLTIPDRNDYKMYLEGQISDQSRIESIKVNNVSAAFNTMQTNPSFAVSLDVAGVEKIEIVAKDENGNSGTANYTLNRSSNLQEVVNPMGKTWVIFIENSNYQYLPSLDAVSNDIAVVKRSMTGYRIDSIITRKNLSKTEMERFFSIDLRNMVNKYDVASLMIWYSGHGKVTTDNGYWLPTDANKKDEYSFFPTTNLKGYLKSYKTVKHHLVIADATETGPAFYLAMRDVSPWQCGDWQATRLKSAQVLSSADPERKNETSAFSSAFAQTLQNSQDKCVTIDHLSERVGKAVQRVQKQKPRFGNIQDMGDENGTFFFIKK